MNLNEFINQNKELFDSDEPDVGHFERFLNKNEKYQKKNKTIKIIKIISLAASIIIPISIIIFINLNNRNILNNNNLKNNTVANYLPGDLKEIENYYNSQINLKLEELDKLQCFKNKEDKQKLLNDLHELDITNKSLIEYLKYNTENERIKNSLINNYQIKNELIEKVLIKIKENC